jgi:HAD superfamily hydrolase (TIGR01458 family)
MMDGSQLIALHKGRYWETESGLKVDLGLFVAGLEYTTGKQARVIGKPSAAIFEMAMREMGLEARDCAMIGDDVYNDVGGAQQAGMEGILIRTGKFRATANSPSEIIPDTVIDSLHDLPALLLRAQ